MMYGFPAINGPNGGIKLAAEQYITATSPQEVVREVGEQEIDEMYVQTVKGKFPGSVASALKRRLACIQSRQTTGSLSTSTLSIRTSSSRRHVQAMALNILPRSGKCFLSWQLLERAPIDISRFSIQRLIKDAA